RAAEELRSALIFRALARSAWLARIPDPWPQLFKAACRDEVRHARLCAEVGRQLGAAAPEYDARPVQARLARLSEPLLRAATLLLVEVAMGETVSTLLFRAGRRSALEPLTRAALTSILADEVRHQRLGWMAMTALWPRLSPAQRRALQTEASSALAAFERKIAAPALDRLRRAERFDAGYAALGVLAPKVRVEAFYFAIERLVLPRLERLGLDGKLAWSERYRADPSLP
ncbi:MAG TPA: diiron oxygenase, partial [Polyangiaceae bacterium]|nr:diiron oxygenase [Polyangiaceae bacterium]